MAHPSTGQFAGREIDGLDDEDKPEEIVQMEGEN